MPTLEPAGADRQSFAAWRAPGYLQSVSRQEAVDWRGVGLLVVLGRGRDGFVKHVLAQRPHVRRVLLVDPSPDAGRGLPKTDRLAVVTDPTGRDLGAKLHVLLREVSWLRYLRTMQVSPASSTVSPPWASAAVAGLKAAAVASLRYYGNDPGDALLGLRHIVANLAQIARARDFGPLRGALEGRTAVVASAGPSLDDALDRLAVAQDELAIVAPDTSLKPLLAKGIRPHVVTCKERTERTIPLLDGVDTEGIILVALPVVPPEALAGWGGPTVAVYSGGAHFPWLGAVGLPRSILRFDGSAGNMAFRVCEELGASRILLVGQDLCFGAGGRTHVRGAANAPSQAIHQAMQRIQVPGVAGRPVWSTPTWLEFVQVYEVDLQRYAGECVNTSPSGAAIRGTTQASLEAALAAVGGPYSARQILPDRLVDGGQGADLSEGIAQSHALVEATVGLCAQGIAAARDAAKAPAEPGDVDDLLAGPLAAVQRLRASILRQPLFHELITPVAQSAIIAAETNIYALQRTCGDDRVLLVEVAGGWVGWFGIVARLAEATAVELPGRG